MSKNKPLQETPVSGVEYQQVSQIRDLRTEFYVVAPLISKDGVTKITKVMVVARLGDADCSLNKAYSVEFQSGSSGAEDSDKPEDVKYRLRIGTLLRNPEKRFLYKEVPSLDLFTSLDGEFRTSDLIDFMIACGYAHIANLPLPSWEEHFGLEETSEVSEG